MNKNILDHFFPNLRTKPYSFKHLDHKVIKYCINAILDDINLLNLFKIPSKIKTILNKWKDEYGGDTQEVRLYNLIKLTAETITKIDEMNFSFLTKNISIHLMLDLEFLKFYLELRGSKTGDVVDLFNSYNTHQKKHDKVEIYLYNMLISLSLIIMQLLTFNEFKDMILICSNYYNELKKNKYHINYKIMYDFVREIKKYNDDKIPLLVSKKISNVTDFVESIVKYYNNEESYNIKQNIKHKNDHNPHVSNLYYDKYDIDDDNDVLEFTYEENDN